jgi:cytochrome bd ubiquinol oxidase subunit II
LAVLIFRAVSIEFRSKESMKWWRKTWDISYSLSSIFMALLLGVVVGNILWGIEIGPNYEFQGHWLDFLHPYALLVGITTVALFMMHGAIYLAMKTEGKLFTHVNKLLHKSIIFFIVAYSIVTVYTLIYIPHLSDDIYENTALFVVPLLAFLSIANVPRLVSKGKYVMAFLFSALTMSFLLILVAIELYPVMILSTMDTAYDITVYNAASSENSLRIMLNITAIGAPLVIIYTVFVYRTFWGKVKLDETSY